MPDMPDPINFITVNDGDFILWTPRRALQNYLETLQRFDVARIEALVGGIFDDTALRVSETIISSPNPEQALIELRSSLSRLA